MPESTSRWKCSTTVNAENGEMFSIRFDSVKYVSKRPEDIATVSLKTMNE